MLGDFDDATFRYYDVESRFFTRDDSYRVITDGPSGALEEYEIAYTFGVYPLQQYLVALDGGRLQPLTIAWDARPVEDGGHRWFHLYPDEFIAHDDPLHWTGPELNWNYMCAECHSTNLEKNFDRGSRTFDTTWSEVNVGCEGCHGPASRHLALAEAGELERGNGLSVDLDDTGGAVWEMNAATGIAERSRVRLRAPRQADACGRCHSRRSQIAAAYDFGRSLLDTHLPALLDDGLYFADGQIRDEVYVWGSFLQSRMYEAGVSCTDCHDPHTAALKTGSEASGVCATCHLRSRFDTREHHHHADGDVDCVDCHMASRNYMQIDGRRDHSFRVPRPDLTASTGAPNACGQCHPAQGPEWADAVLRNWFGPARSPHFAAAIHAGRTRGARANALLVAAADDPTQPGIARGTALSLLAWPLDTAAARAIRAGLGSGDPLIRLGAARALRSAPADIRMQWASSLLDDPLLALRLEAVGVLLPLRSSMPGESFASFAEAENEYLAAQLVNAERPEAYTNLGGMFLARGDVPRAERSFRTALDIQPLATPARVNLADLYRQLSRDEDAQALLEEGLALDPDNGALRHALGLLLVRQQETEAALAELERAAELDPDNPRYAYVYGVGLNSIGETDAAIAVLERARQSFDGDFDIGWALVTTLRDAGRSDDARIAAESLRQQFPDNPDVAALLDTLTD